MGKRKNNTSTEARNRYNAAHYLKVSANVPIADAKRFREKCLETGIPQATVLKDAIYKFLGDK